jgi:hypothetical protein
MSSGIDTYRCAVPPEALRRTKFRCVSLTDCSLLRPIYPEYTILVCETLSMQPSRGVGNTLTDHTLSLYGNRAAQIEKTCTSISGIDIIVLHGGSFAQAIYLNPGTIQVNLMPYLRCQTQKLGSRNLSARSQRSRGPRILFFAPSLDGNASRQQSCQHGIGARFWSYILI